MERKLPPTHPGEILKGLYIEPNGLSITELAKNLGVSRMTLHRITKGTHPVTIDMALRLSKALKTSPQLWLNLQQKYDLFHALKSNKAVKSIKPIKLKLLD